MPDITMCVNNKCPVCQWCNQQMFLQDDIFVCANTDCAACAESFLHKALTQSKRDLKIARRTLIKLKSEYNRYRKYEFDGEDIDWEWWAMSAKNIVENTLKRIEHKENK